MAGAFTSLEGFPISVEHSGPGFLVSWPPVHGAESYIVSRARKESLSFYPLESTCCPITYENLLRPCCPVSASRLSLQVEDLEPGLTYRFRVKAVGTTNQSRPSDPVVSPATPDAPAAPWVYGAVWASPTDSVQTIGSVVDLRWERPDDRGAPLLGYRVLGRIETQVLNTSWITLLANSSSATPRLSDFALLPSARYTLAIQGINSVGVGPMGAERGFVTEPAPAASVELAVGQWARAELLRGGSIRHRVFVPPASQACAVRLQVHALRTRTLLQVGRAREPHLLLPEDLPASPEAGVWNVSTDDGELTLLLEQPPSDWYYLLIHSAAAVPAAMDVDIHVAVDSTAEVVADAMGTVEQYEHLAPDWRYVVDPEGRSQYDPWVVKRFMHPLAQSIEPTPGEGYQVDAVRARVPPSGPAPGGFPFGVVPPSPPPEAPP